MTETVVRPLLLVVEKGLFGAVALVTAGAGTRAGLVVGSSTTLGAGR